MRYKSTHLDHHRSICYFLHNILIWGVYMSIKKSLATVGGLVALALFASTANAGHPWANYHWERASNPLSLELGDNMNSTWDDHLLDASTDWNVSSVLETSVVPGGAKPRNCRPTAGRVEVCNSGYGNTGWLGIAQIWASGDHITQGVVKNNDFYFDTPTYNTDAWRQFVTCQEIGHTFGLGHQDEVFDNANLGSCMDYTNSPETNQLPNQHDFDQLEAIYAHLDSDGGGGGGGGGNCNPRSPKCSGFSGPPAFGQLDLNGPGQWGRLIGASASGRTSVYELDFGNGYKFITHVIWALESD